MLPIIIITIIIVLVRWRCWKALFFLFYSSFEFVSLEFLDENGEENQIKEEIEILYFSIFITRNDYECLLQSDTQYRITVQSLDLLLRVRFSFSQTSFGFTILMIVSEFPKNLGHRLASLREFGDGILLWEEFKCKCRDLQTLENLEFLQIKFKEFLFIRIFLLICRKFKPLVVKPFSCCVRHCLENVKKLLLSLICF